MGALTNRTPPTKSALTIPFCSMALANVPNGDPPLPNSDRFHAQKAARLAAGLHFIIPFLTILDPLSHLHFPHVEPRLLSLSFGVDSVHV